MCKTKILVIENSDEDFKKIIDNFPGYEFLPSNFASSKQTITTSAAKACVHISDIIKENYTELRCIICDLRIVDYNRGQQIIKYIRSQLSIEDYPYFAKLIPIIAYSKYTDNDMPQKALSNGANVAYNKNSPIEYLNCVVRKQVEDFSLLCDNFILKKPYKVGITFCGKDTRPFVQKMATELAIKYSKDKVFFDEFHNDKIVGLDADKVLQKIYTQQSEYIILLISKNYKRNHWTGNVEWKAIKEKLIPLRNNVIIPVLCDTKIRIDDLNLNKDIVIRVINNNLGQQNLTESEVVNKIIKIIEEKEK